MPRRPQTPRKGKYSPPLTRTTDRFVVKLMKDGKKGLAEKILRQEWGVDTVAWVSSVGSEEASGVDIASVTREQVDQHLSRCPDKASAQRMEALVREVLEAKDSVGGVVSCVSRLASCPLQNKKLGTENPL